MDFNISLGSFVQEENFTSFDPGRTYDVIILGGGPAGLTAAVYCMRKGVSTGLILAHVGGQVAETAGIENYMGYRYINGMELVEKFREQVMQFGISYEEGVSAVSITDGDIKKVELDDGRVFSSRAVIIATGKTPRRLNVPGELEFTGRGVAYCSTCDAPLFGGKRVVVAGGGNSAAEAVIDLLKVASHVTMVQFLDRLTADAVLVRKIESNDNLDVLYEHEILEVKGDTGVTGIRVRNRITEEERDIVSDGIFVEIGLSPNSEFVKDLLELNQTGEILVDCACRTSVPGIFAAGDVTTVPFKQIIVAGGEGAKAALSACDYIFKH